MYDTLKKFFTVKTKNGKGELLSHQHENEHHYKLKLPAKFKIEMGMMNTICCCICKERSKHHKTVDRILERGEEKLKKYINAEFIFETLKKH